MSYEYIAGFFDGEGSVGVTGKMPFVAMSQARRNNAVLRRMRLFLIADGIGCGVYHVKPRKECFKLMRMSVLKINSVDAMRLLLSRLEPFLFVKRVRANEVIAYIDATGFNTRRAFNLRVQSAKADYLAGMSATGAAAKNNICWKSLRDLLRAEGIEVRGASASKKLWWSKLDAEKRKNCCAALDEYRNSH